MHLYKFTATEQLKVRKAMRDALSRVLAIDLPDTILDEAVDAVVDAFNGEDRRVNRDRSLRDLVRDYEM